MPTFSPTLRHFLDTTRTRRGALSLLSVLLAMTGADELSSARKRQQKRKRKRSRKKKNEPLPQEPPPLNAFGCLDIGAACGGQSGQCCSSICEGSAPQPGEPDVSRCVAHNTGGCQLTDDSCGFDRPEVPCGNGGVCVRTTGNAGFCAAISRVSECAACRRDEDCQGAFGPGAACVICETFPCDATGKRACLVPAA